MRTLITEFTKPVGTSNVCVHSRMFDYLWVTGNHPYHTHVSTFAFIHLLSDAEMSRKTSYIW